MGDSKEGWVQATTHYFEIITNPLIRVNEIEIVYDSVRPKGERLKTFGGTASGHESLKNMFEKIHNVITTDIYAPRPVNGKLRPIHLLDICNIIGENVVVGGVRRTSEIALLDANDKESIEAKSNLTPEKYHRFMSNNSIFYNEKPSRDQLAWQFQVLKETGEPCFVNAEAGRKRNPNFQGVNPCFTGDMRLLTKSGYVRFDELVDTRPIIINKDGVESESKVWCSGEKEVYEIMFINRNSMTCTGNHVFMTIDGEEVEAKDLKGKRIMPFISKPVDLDEHYIKLGFIQGDGCLSRLESETHLGLEVNLGKDDGDVKKLFGFNGEGKLFYTKEYTSDLIELGFSSECLPNRLLPSSIKSWNNKQKKSFLNGLYSANGSVISSGRIALKSTCKELLNEVQELLSEIGINSYITTNKSKKVSFSNGDYVCKESYDLNVQQYESRLKFYQEIGFMQEYKMIKLEQILISQSPKVLSSNSTGKMEKVYDFTEPITHWGVVEGLIAHNCVEILLDDKQTCNLTTVNVLAFVEDGKLNLEELLEAQRLSARAGLRMTCLELELPAWNEVQKRDRLLGCSITGFKDAIELLNFSIEEETELQKKMGDVVRKASREYAEEIGISVPLLSTALKPEGTLSQVFGGVSSGLHHAHSPYYIRRVRINAHDPLCKTLEESGWELKNEVGQGVEVNGIITPVMTKVVEFPMFSPVKRTKYEVPAMEQLETYYNFQSNYTDHNSSNTITVKDEEWEGVEQNIWDNWDDMVAVSFLKLDGHVYDLAPYEAITKEQYEEMLTKVKPIQMHLLAQFETGEEEEDLGTNDDCSSGSCPIR